MGLISLFRGLLKPIPLVSKEYSVEEVVVTIPLEVYEKLIRLADQQGVSVSDMVVKLAKRLKEKSE